ncbi:hypothetical protein BD289DRAFT_246417 [Coniella lustricola]|uniref:UDP-glucose 6-dehydrogenase n=1 Tax=Coniella lustricola TaxID=2025994 RepID=A0A2T3A8Z9_9PEZI|nr:hypothetical protein BD289DRAFT_246417 [Coniella lustricola]
MAPFSTEIEIPPPLLRDMSTSSLTASSCWVSDNSWASDGATPTTSPSSSRGESPEPKLDTVSSQDGHEAVEPSLSTPSVKNICFVGAGFVGGPTAALIAYHNPHMTVNVVDLNAERIAAWNSNHLPIHETGLPKIVRIARDGTKEAQVILSRGFDSLSSSSSSSSASSSSPSSVIRLEARTPNLRFSCDVTAAISEADVLFVCVNTPTKMYGVGAGASADLGALEAATRTIAKNAKAGAVIVEKSTVPCGTARIIQSILLQHRPETPFEVLSNPEFLAEGSAVANLMRPDRILIGSSSTPSGLAAAAALRSVYAAWVPTARILTVNTFSSELTKLIANAMLAQRISSINAVSALCEDLGADVEQVSRALGADSRLGAKFLHAGIGFGGSCFEKDILNLAYLARCMHLEEVADYWTSVLNINRYQRERFARTVIRKLNGTLRGKKLAIFGFAFKDSTNDTRNSVAVHVIAELLAEQPREIAVFDPGCAPEEIADEIARVVDGAARGDKKLSSSMMARIKITSGWREAADGASAVCILTQWDHFRDASSMASVQRAAPLASTDNLSSILSVEEQHKEHSEMDICVLEQIVRNMDQDTDADDPLQRLVPPEACQSDCKDCARSSASSGESDFVDWETVYAIMEDHSWIFDGRKIVNCQYLESLGFKVHSIGRGL